MMPGSSRHAPDPVDGLSTRQYHAIAHGNDEPTWNSQQQGFSDLRDLAERLRDGTSTHLNRLRDSWSGEGASALSAEIRKLIDVLERLRDSAASNSDGMREMAAVMARVRSEIDDLHHEDAEWRANPDGDDPETLAVMRESVRTDMRDTIKDAAEQHQHLAQSYLLEPPSIAGIDATTNHQLQDPARTHSAPDPADPTPNPETPPEPPMPLLPMEPAAATLDGATPAPDGAVCPEVRHQPASPLRSDASRQGLLNQRRHDQRPPAPTRDRRRALLIEDDDSPFAPGDPTVVPPVISGGVDPGPHGSGPVLTGTVHRQFPEYRDKPATPAPQTELEDGSSVSIQFGGKSLDFSELSHDDPHALP